MSCFEVPDSLLRAEGFYYCLDVLYGGLGEKQIAIFYLKNLFFSAVNFFEFLVIKILDPDPDRYLS